MDTIVLEDSLKISIITPVFNQVNFIEHTILSVINQGYDNLEYIIVDGGSTDGTIDIIKKYESNITYWISEPDNGMYDALNKGLQKATGQVMTWINSDDLLLPNALENMKNLFIALPQVNWIHGLNSFIDLEGNIIYQDPPQRFSLIKFLNKDYKFIQQESTFWRRSLWEKSGGYIDTNLKLAGDFELWFRFFQHDNLYTSMLPIGAWRKREGQLSDLYMNEYEGESEYVISSYKKTLGLNSKILKLQLLHFIMKFLKRNDLPFHFIKKRIKIIENVANTQIVSSKENNSYKLI